eukprot:snap_masked-scaffold_9-processed-gene-6.40-mRNA-1 protein AED:1.00 eAED:1.00 QI:0/0/0/0/1/1/3/0/89
MNKIYIFLRRHVVQYIIDDQLIIKIKQESFDKNQNSISIIDNQNQNDSQIIVDDPYQIRGLIGPTRRLKTLGSYKEDIWPKPFLASCGT